jgi:hypothetical protein
LAFENNLFLAVKAKNQKAVCRPKSGNKSNKKQADAQPKPICFLLHLLKYKTSNYPDHHP